MNVFRPLPMPLLSVTHAGLQRARSTTCTGFLGSSRFHVAVSRVRSRGLRRATELRMPELAMTLLRFSSQPSS